MTLFNYKWSFAICLLLTVLAINPYAIAANSSIQGQVEGQALVIEVDKGELAKILRQDYQLTEQTVTKPGTHPLLILLMNFKKVRPESFGPVTWPSTSYQSIYILVPYTTLKNQFNLPASSVMPVGYMNSNLMKLLSRRYSGLPKIYARIQNRPSRYQAIKHKAQLLSAVFKPVSTDLGQVELRQKSQMVMDLIDLPILSDKPIGSKKFGLSKAQINWNGSTIVPQKVWFQFWDGTIPGLSGRQSFLPDILEHNLGAFSFSSTFEVSSFKPLN